MHTTQYVYCAVLLLIDLLIFWFTAMSMRTRKRTSRSFAFERAKTGFFLSQVSPHLYAL
jgi:hypothetical protein